jgi:restriction system protein
MAVPSFDSLILPVLETLADGKIHRPQEVSDKVAARLGVSAEDQAEMLPSGAMPRYRNRILWALHYMKRAGVIASPGRGQYVIADSGRALLARLMVRHRVGVIVTKTLPLTRLDSDYFDSGMEA